MGRISTPSTWTAWKCALLFDDHMLVWYELINTSSAHVVETCEVSRGTHCSQELY